MKRRGTLKNYEAPNYAGMGNVVFHGRAEGLVTNTTNSYGVVNASGHVTKWISILTTVHEFDGNGTAANITLTGSGVDKAIEFAGSARLRHNGLSSVFNNFHFRSALNDLKWQVHGVIKFGTTSDPNASLGFFGNNGTSTSNKGIHGLYGDASGSNNNNVLSFAITRGSSNSFILLSGNSNIIPPNQYVDFFLKVDKSQAQESQARAWINGYEYTVFDRIDSSVMVTTPTFAMEIGGCGNATVAMTGGIKEITFQDGIDTDSFIKTFIQARMAKYRITPQPRTVNDIIQKPKLELQSTFDETRYYLTSFWLQKPSDPNILVNIFTDTVDHVYNVDRKVSRRISTDMGRTISSKSDAFNPVGTSRPIDPGAGYGDDDRLHIITDAQNGTGTGLTHQLMYTYSDDDGATWSTPVDLASSLPSDGLLSWRVYCGIIENDGRLMTVIYKLAEEGDITSSARYLFYSDDNGANWSTFLIQTQGSGQFRNESAIVALSSTVLLVVSRDEGTNEWYQSMSTDNGATWSNQGALTFGEALTQAGPVRLKKFQISGTDVIACYFPDRTGDMLKVCYGTAANLISSGLTGWNLSSKFVIYQGSSNLHLHYGDVCHYNNDFHSNAIYPRDPFPSSGAGTQNTLNQYEFETAHYPSIKSLLGL